MSLSDRYLATLTLLYMATTALLAVYGQQGLDLYISVYLIEYLAVTLIFSQLHPRIRTLLSVVGSVLFAGFVAVALGKVFQVALGAGLG